MCPVLASGNSTSSKSHHHFLSLDVPMVSRCFTWSRMASRSSSLPPTCLALKPPAVCPSSSSGVRPRVRRRHAGGLGAEMKQLGRSWCGACGACGAKGSMKGSIRQGSSWMNSKILQTDVLQQVLPSNYEHFDILGPGIGGLPPGCPKRSRDGTVWVDMGRLVSFL